MLILSCMLLAGSLTCISILLSKKSPVVMTSTTPDQPDAYVENVTATIMSKEGKPTLKLQTPKMTHYAKNDMSDIATPHVIIYRESVQPWHVNANHAKALHGTSEITFWDNVIIHHIADNDNPTTAVHTPTLTIFPEKQLAKTNEAITFTQPNNIIYAVGMLANLGDGTIKLLSQAREDYVPSS